MYHAITLLSLLVSAVVGQQAGTQQAETHPSLTSQKCTASGCTTQQTKIVLDANWRWLHTTSGYTNCYTGNTWDATLCPDNKSCAANCALDGADYSGTYGITTSGNALTIKFVTGKNIGSRVYLLASDTKYQMFKMKNQEFTFDVDMSKLGCGLNGALYMVQMDEDGGMAKYPTNKAGAKYGTGYCDAQCPHDLKFINGEANVEGWTPSDNDVNAGKGKYGTCCTEMDIWEANFNAAAYTPHPCTPNSQYRCSGTECGDGDQRYQSVCDKDGCDFNSYRMGDQTFLGQGKTIDTNRKFTVVTQFITSTGTASGTLSEIRRIYVQDGKVYQNSQSKISGVTGNSITDSFCTAQKTAFSDQNQYQARGGLAKVGQAFDAGMVLALSIWDDHEANMLWLDSSYPLDRAVSQPGVLRGPCATTSGVPKDVEANQGSSQVIFSNIKWGDLNTTYSTTGGGGTTPGGGTTTTTTPGGGGGNCAALWGQCGGQGWTGPTCCSAGTCKAQNQWYSQCLN